MHRHVLDGPLVAIRDDGLIGHLPSDRGTLVSMSTMPEPPIRHIYHLINLTLSNAELRVRDIW